MQMRIAHIVDSFSPPYETFIYDTVLALESHGVDNQVITFSRDNEVARPFRKVIVVPLPKKWSPGRLSSRAALQLGYIDRDQQYAGMLRSGAARALSDIEPDVIHAHFGPSGFFAAPLARALKIPLIVSFHGYDASKLLKMPKWRDRYKTVFSDADCVTAVSSHMLDLLIRSGLPPSRGKVVHIGKRLEDYPYSGPKGRVAHWLAVGRLVEKKGHADAIDAFDKALRNTGATLDIVGGGELLESLRAHVIQRGLEEEITFLGQIPYAEIQQRMAAADAFILSSKSARDGDSEGIPTVLIEAQAMGLPVVATRHAGIPEGIPEENHWLLAHEGNVDDIADRMSRVAKNPKTELERITRAGRIHVEQNFTLSTQAKILTDLYQSFAGGSIDTNSRRVQGHVR
jgi:colanic acid/amylovoran biosynthesis glycosyltransferase